MARPQRIDFLTVARRVPPAGAGASHGDTAPTLARPPGLQEQVLRRELANGQELSLRAGTTRDLLTPPGQGAGLHHPLATAAWRAPDPEKRTSLELPPGALLAQAEAKGRLLALTLVELSPLSYVSFASAGAPGMGPARRLLSHLRVRLRDMSPALVRPEAVCCLMGLERIPIVILSALHTPEKLDPVIRILREATVQSLEQLGEPEHQRGPAALRARICALPGPSGPNPASWERTEAAVGDVYTMLLPPRDRPSADRGGLWAGGFLELTTDGTVCGTGRRIVLGPFDAIRGSVPDPSPLTAAPATAPSGDVQGSADERSSRAAPEPPTDASGQPSSEADHDEQKTVRQLVTLGMLWDLAYRADSPDGDEQTRVVVAWHREASSGSGAEAGATSQKRRELARLLRRVSPDVNHIVFGILNQLSLRSGCLADSLTTAREFADRLALLLQQDLAAFVEVYEGVQALAGFDKKPPRRDRAPGKHWVKLLRRVLRLLRLRGTTLQRPPDLRGFDNRVAFEIIRHAVRCLARSFLRHHGLDIKVLVLEHDDEQPHVDFAGLPHGVGIHIHPAWLAQPFWWTVTLLHELSHAVHNHQEFLSHAPVRAWRAKVAQLTGHLAPQLGCLELRNRWRAPEALLRQTAAALQDDGQDFAARIVLQGNEVLMDLTAVSTIRQALDLRAPDDAATNRALAWTLFWWCWLPAVLRAAGTDYGTLQGTEQPRVSRESEEALAVRILLLGHVQSAHLHGALAGELYEPKSCAFAIGQAVDFLRHTRRHRAVASPPPLADTPTATVRTPVEQALRWLAENTAPDIKNDQPGPFVWPAGELVVSEGEQLGDQELQTAQHLMRGIVALGHDLVENAPLTPLATPDTVPPETLNSREHVPAEHILRTLATFLVDHRAALSPRTGPAPVALPLLLDPSAPGGQPDPPPAQATETIGISARFGSMEAPVRSPETTAQLEQASAVEHRFLLDLASMDRWSRLRVLNKMLEDTDPPPTPKAPEASPAGPE